MSESDLSPPPPEAPAEGPLHARLKLVHDFSNPSQDNLSPCLLPLLDALGWKGDQQQLHEAMPRTGQSMNLGSFLNTMANMNFEGRSTRISPNHCHAKILPCLFINDQGEGDGFVLLKKTELGFMLYDGKAKDYQDRALPESKGTALTFTPMNLEGNGLLLRQPHWFLQLSLRFNQLYLLGFILSVILSVLALSSPLFVMAIYSQLQVAGAMPPTVMIGVGILLFICADGGLRFIRSRIFTHLSERSAYILSTQVLRRILNMPPAMTENATTQNQISRLQEFESISSFFSGPAINGLLDLITSGILLAGMIWIGGSLVWVPIIAISSAAIFVLMIRSLLSKAANTSSKTESKRQELLYEMLSHFRSLKTTGVSDSMLEQYYKLCEESNLNQLEVNRVNTLVSTFSHGLNQLSGLFTMVYGVHLVLMGDLQSSSLLACMLLTWKILSPIRNLFTVISQVEKTIKSIQQLNRFMNLPQELQVQAHNTLNHKIHGDITFNGVSMKSASETQAALMGVSFKARREQILLICGHGGTDGANVLEAILRLRDIQSGTIAIDDMNIRQFDVTTLRRSINYVPQNIQLFKISLRDNLKLSNPTVTEKELQDVLAKANLIKDLSSLPQGLDTLVDGREEQFSDSFLKRFSFARAWLRPASIMLYLLPDQGLTESRILEACETISQSKNKFTTIIVSNNRHFFNIADTAIWLDQGKVKVAGKAMDIAAHFYSDSP
jgi:ATP-binding cassette, subfamily C, bacterial LapB